MKSVRILFPAAALCLTGIIASVYHIQSRQHESHENLKRLGLRDLGSRPRRTANTTLAGPVERFVWKERVLDPNLAAIEVLIEYARWHKSARESVLQYGAGKGIKVLVFTPIFLDGTSRGLGNRLNGLVSTFILAMVTGRLFLLDWREPVDWRLIFEVPLGLDWDLRDFQREYRARHQENIPTVHLEDEMNLKEILSSRNFDEMDDRMPSPSLTVASSTFFYFYLWRNTNLPPMETVLGKLVDTPARLINAGLGDGRGGEPTMQRLVGGTLFRPSAAVREMVSGVRSEANGRLIVGLHLRLGTPETGHIWPPHKLQQSRDLVRVAEECAAVTLRNFNAVIFVASDVPEVVERLEISIGKENIIQNSGTIAHSAGSSEFSQRLSVSVSGDAMLTAQRKVVGDLLTLSQSDILFGTFYSSFSEWAAELGNTPTYQLPNLPPWCTAAGVETFTTIIE